MNFENTLAFAQQLDVNDKLQHFRQNFLIPQHNGKDCIDFTGNSLGLQPKNAATEIKKVLDNWATLAVEGHFKGNDPWMHFHDHLTKPTSEIVGCLQHEVAIIEFTYGEPAFNDGKFLSANKKTV